jgi:hypothetical protein
MVPVDATDGTARTPRTSSRWINCGAVITHFTRKTSSTAFWHRVLGGIISVRTAILISPAVRDLRSFLTSLSGIFVI